MDDGQRRVFFTAGDGIVPPDAASNSPDDINLGNWVNAGQLKQPNLGVGQVQKDQIQRIGQSTIQNFSAAQGFDRNMPQNLGQNALFSAGVGFKEVPANEVERQAIFSGSQNESVEYPASIMAGQDLAEPLDARKQFELETVASTYFRQEKILTEGDKLNGAALEEVKKLETKLNQDGNIASFYDDFRDAAKANLEHSFGRRVGQ